MSSLRLIIASLIYHWRTNLAVACGVMAATAVLSGALLVGDSMRGSLRRLTLERLGRIDEVLLTDGFFREKLADELAAGPGFEQYFTDAVPVIILQAGLQNPGKKAAGRANQVNLIGCDARFWALGSGETQDLSRKRVALNEPLAEKLGVEVGDDVVVRLGSVRQVPAESLLGREDETAESLRLTVGAKIPAEGLGRFSLRPNQQLPLNAYVSLAALQEELDRPNRVNAILVAGKTADADPPRESKGILQELLKPTLDDYGIRVERTPRGYFNVTSQRMLLEPAAEKAVSDALDGLEIQPVLTYLANAMTCQGRTIPYSTITAVDFKGEPPLGPFVSRDGKSPIPPLAEGQIVLNSWAADDLHARPGDTIRVRYFEPESTHGQLREKPVDLQLAAVAKLEAAADDRDLTPKVAGVTDQLSMATWNPPFPFDPKRIRDEDEQYWEDHGPTPKAFVSLATGRRLWGSRFGQTTSIRVRPLEGMTVEALKDKLELDPAEMGFVFQPVKREGLKASEGTTPFSILFLAFSFFIIAAAVMLVALLFRLGIEHRAGQIGILVATGFSRRKIARLLAAEGLLTATLGSLLGVPAGVGYAALMMLGLQTWWLGAIGTPFLRLCLAPTSLAIGFASGLIVAFLAIVYTVWRTRRVSPRQLLAGRTTGESPWIGSRPRYAGKLAAGLLIAAVAIGLLAMRFGEETRAGAFFGAGALVLIASLTFVWMRLRTGATGAAVAVGRGNLTRMAVRNAARNPGRSTLTIGLVAAACFLIVAVSAFHLDPTQQVPTLQSGNGGFALVAQSDLPIYQDLDTPEGRRELGFSTADSELMAESTTIALRVKPGDDASCLNLYQPRQPRVLGVSKKFIDRGGFRWADSAALTPAERENPWLLLEKPIATAMARRVALLVGGVGHVHLLIGEIALLACVPPVIPVVIDKNTAMYSLHLWGGVGETYDVTDGRGRKVRLKVVGLLDGSIFQGDLLISEKAFLRHFPEVNGYRLFLKEPTSGRVVAAQRAALLVGGFGQVHLLNGQIALLACVPEEITVVRNALERTLGDYGLATETTGRRLARFLLVQNTYLSTFQSLGGLGLLLGTFGLAAVQLRNVLERRGELALLRAAGFRRSMLAKMVMLENSLLLIVGLGCGVLAALVAVLPHLLTRGASIPWLPLAATLALVLAVGLLAGLAAVRSAVCAPLMGALREQG